MWTEITRPHYRRKGPGYSSSMTDGEWALIAQFMPSRRRLGRPREVELRRVVDAILYIVSAGCAWRLLPREFPPVSTVQGYFYRWRDDGTWERINHALIMAAREAARAAADREAALRAILSHRQFDRPLRAFKEHSLPGTRQRGQLGRLLRAWHHLHRS